MLEEDVVDVVVDDDGLLEDVVVDVVVDDDGLLEDVVVDVVVDDDGLLEDVVVDVAVDDDGLLEEVVVDVVVDDDGLLEDVVVDAVVDDDGTVEAVVVVEVDDGTDDVGSSTDVEESGVDEVVSPVVVVVEEVEVDCAVLVAEVNEASSDAPSPSVGSEAPCDVTTLFPAVSTEETTASLYIFSCAAQPDRRTVPAIIADIIFKAKSLLRFIVFLPPYAAHYKTHINNKLIITQLRSNVKGVFTKKSSNAKNRLTNRFYGDIILA